MRDYTTMKALVNLLEDVQSDLTRKLEWNRQSVETEQRKKDTLEKHEDGSYTCINEDGETEELGRWDAEYIETHLKEYKASVKACELVIEHLANMDLNKVKM